MDLYGYGTELIYNTFMLIQDVALKTNRERWMIEMGGARGSWRSVLALQHDDDKYFFFLPIDRIRKCPTTPG